MLHAAKPLLDVQGRCVVCDAALRVQERASERGIQNLAAYRSTALEYTTRSKATALFVHVSLQRAMAYVCVRGVGTYLPDSSGLFRISTRASARALGSSVAPPNNSTLKQCR